MRRVIARACLHTRLKFIWHAFYHASKTDMNLSGQVVFRTSRRPASVVKKDSNMDALLESFQNFQNGYFFETIRDGCFQKFKQPFFLERRLWVDE